MNHRLSILGLVGVLALAAGDVRADLSLLDSFNPTQAASLCGLAYDPGADEVWVYGCFGTDLQRYSRTGTFLGAIARPGEAADDADLKIALEPLQIKQTAVPQGSLLLFNGESLTTDIYALDRTTGAVLCTLVTASGNSHVVGGTYHPRRNTFFLLQDHAAGGNGNRIAEVNSITGAVVQSFPTGAFIDVSYGDIEVCAASENLFVVSSVSSSMIEITPDGAFVGSHPLPATVTALSGLGPGPSAGELWAGGTGGLVWRMTGPACGTVAAEPSTLERDGVTGILALHPNPATEATRLRFVLGLAAPVTIRVHDVAGRTLRTLGHRSLAAGAHEVTWDARDDRGARLPAGTYFVRVTTPQWSETRTVVLL